jgi:hypothetical protein
MADASTSDGSFDAPPREFHLVVVATGCSWGRQLATHRPARHGRPPFASVRRCGARAGLAREQIAGVVSAAPNGTIRDLQRWLPRAGPWPHFK